MKKFHNFFLFDITKDVLLQEWKGEGGGAMSI